MIWHTQQKMDATLRSCNPQNDQMSQNYRYGLTMETENQMITVISPKLFRTYGNKSSSKELQHYVDSLCDAWRARGFISCARTNNYFHIRR